MNRTYSLRERAFYLLIGKIIAFVLNIAVPVVLVRLLSQQNYGFYQQFWLMSLTVTPMLAFGIHNSLFYFYPTSRGQEDKTALLSRTFFSLLGMAVIGLCVAVILKSHIIGLLKCVELDQFYWALILHIFFSVVSACLQNLFLIEGKATRSMWFEIYNQLSRAVMLIFAVLVFHTVSAAVWALVIQALINSAYLFAYLLYHYRIDIRTIRFSDLMAQIKYVLPMGLGAIVGTIGDQADKLILTALFTTRDYALYSVGNFRIPIIATLYETVGDVILTRISEYSKAPHGKLLALELYKKMLRLNAMVTIPIIVFSITFAGPIITFLFGDNYQESVNVFRVTLLIFFFQMLGHGYILRGYAQTGHILLSNLFKMAFSICCGYFLIKHYGIKGAALAYTIAFSLNSVIQLNKGRQILGVPWSTFFPWRDFVVIGLISGGGAIVSALCYFIPLHKMVLILAAGLMYCTIVAAMLMKRGYITQEMIARVKTALGIRATTT